MTVKIWIILFAICGVTQAKLMPLDPIKAAVDAAVGVVQKASNDVKMAVDAVLKLPKKIIEDLENMVKDVESKAQDDMNIVHNGLYILNESIENIPLAGGCVTVRNVTGLAQEGVTDVVSCVTDKIQEFADLVQSTLELGQDAIHIGQNATTGIQSCTKLPTALVCIAGQVTDATTAIIKVGMKVATIAAKGAALGGTLQTDLTICAARQTIGVVIKAATISLDVGKCILKAIAPM